MSVLEKIKEILDSFSIEYEILNHEPVYTSLDAAKIRDTGLSNGAKALVFMADGKPILIVVPGDKKVDLRKFKQKFSIKDLRMASKEEVKDITTLEVGSIPPVGKAMNLKSYFDSSFLEKDVVAFNAGSHLVSIRMKAKDLIKVESPVIYEFKQ